MPFWAAVVMGLICGVMFLLTFFINYWILNCWKSKQNRDY